MNHNMKEEKMNTRKMDDAVKEKIMKELAPLFESAQKNKLFFFNSYRNIIMSPKQLRKKQSTGNCLWGKDNWSLIDPKKYITELKEKVSEMVEIIKEYES